MSVRWYIPPLTNKTDLFFSSWFRSRPHVSGYFENGGFILPFSKKFRVHTSRFQIVFACSGHMTSSFSKTSVFLCPYGSSKYPVKKIYDLGTVFKKFRFSVIKNSVYMWTEAVSGEKKLRFQNYLDTNVWTGP